MSRVVVLVGSMRRNGNTRMLAESFARGAERNNDVELISVADHDVHPCIGCNRCYTSEGNRCFRDDGMTYIYDRLSKADVVVIASPIYFYGLTAQLKAVIDRLHAPVRNTFRIRKLALLLVGAAELPELFDAVIEQYRLILNFFHLEDLGTVLVRGVRDPGDIAGNKALDEAYKLGLSIV